MSKQNDKNPAGPEGDYKGMMACLGYVCIYSQTRADAVEQIVRVVTGGAPGFQEGADYYEQHITKLLDGGTSLDHMITVAGPTFSEDDWRAILRDVQQRLRLA